MHHVVAMIAERQGSSCTNFQGLMQNYNRVGVSLEAASLFLRGRGKAVYV
ncbi:hypothetical protein Hanom_Chr17g01565311 [Helianthus anomalus]